VPVTFTFDNTVYTTSRSRDILGTKNLKWVTWPRPFQGHFIARRLQFAMMNPYTKLEVSVFTHYENMKGNAEYRNCGGLGDYGSPKVNDNVSIWWSAYDFLFGFNRNNASTLYLFRVIASYLSNLANFNTHLHLAPALGWPRSSFAEIFGVRKLESLIYHVPLHVWSYVEPFSYKTGWRVTDRRTDGWIDTRRWLIPRQHSVAR